MRELHCWKSNVEHTKNLYGFGSEQWAEALNNPSTCMLLDGHEGLHKFIPDGDIIIKFADKQ